MKWAIEFRLFDRNSENAEYEKFSTCRMKAYYDLSDEMLNSSDASMMTVLGPCPELTLPLADRLHHRRRCRVSCLCLDPCSCWMLQNVATG